ncbi:MAG: Zn-dependent alcohol dehydrogenase [Acidimicrobiales bacterium]
MRGAVLHTSPGELEITELAVDDPGPREVLVRTAAAGLCHSDLHAIDGSIPARLPACLGHEAAGVVEAVGDQVHHVAPGDHVISCLSVFCGHCEHCVSGAPNRCRSTEMRRGPDERPRLRFEDGTPVNQWYQLSSFAELMLVHENALVKIVDDIALDRAALIGCGVVTGVGAVIHTAAVKPGETVAVIGCGGIGLNCVQGARLAGAGRIIAVDRVPMKLELARRFGATDTVDASSVDPVGAVIEMTGGGVDHAFEAIGLKVTAEQAFAMLTIGGTATVVGLLPPGTNIEVAGLSLIGERKLQGSLMGSNRFRVDMPRLVDLYLQGRLDLDNLISARITLDEVNAGFKAMQTGEVARSVIVFS